MVSFINKNEYIIYLLNTKFEIWEPTRHHIESLETDIDIYKLNRYKAESGKLNM